MKFFKWIMLACLCFVVMSCKKRDIADIVPEYKFLKDFSKKIKPKTELILRSYGINNDLPKDYKINNHLVNLTLMYSISKNRNDKITIEDARSLAVTVSENLLQQINSDSYIVSELESYPFSSDFITLSIYFEDENRVELGQGISHIYFGNGKIKYYRYEIEKYTGKYPAKGKHFNVHTETYAQALEIVKKNGGPKKLID